MVSRYLSLIVAGLLCILLVSGCSQKKTQSIEDTERDIVDIIVSGNQESESFPDSEVKSTKDEMPNEGGETIVPRSVRALQEEAFSGSDLVFEKIESSNTIYTRYRISYRSNGLKISGIMNIPHGEGPYPLVILNHGHIDPAIYTVGRGLKREQDYLARNGYAVLHTDYRNHGLSDKDPTLTERYLFRSYFYSMDAINAILAVRELNDPRIDTTRVGMMGHSMGGGVTMHALLAQPELIDAAVLYAPVHSQEFDNMHRWRYKGLSEVERTEWTELVGDLTVRETFEPYSASTFLDEIEAPIKVYHGTLDDSVPYDRSVETFNLFEQAGKKIELITYEGEVHEFVTHWSDFMAGVVEFFDEELSK